MLFIIILRNSIYLIASINSIIKALLNKHDTTFKTLISLIYTMKLLRIIVMSKMTMLIILNIEHNYILK